MESQPRPGLEANDDPQFSGSIDAPPLVRVVIPAYRARNTIRDVVAAVLNSRGRFDLEVVVVDDGENFDLRQILCGMPVTIVSTGGSGSAAIARNAGANGFRGEYIVFVDSDVLVDEACIKRLLEPLQAHSADATVGNYSKNVAGLPFASRYKQLYISSVYERRAGYLTNEFWTATCAIDAATFHFLKGFDPRFRGAGGEDTELGHRLSANGHRIMAVPRAVSDHRHSMSVLQLLKNDWRKGLMAMRCYFQRSGAITHNRHATRRDMLAVGLADFAMTLLALIFFLYSTIGLQAGLMFLGSLLVYAAVRADILRAFLSQGASFVVRAFGVMFLLDLTRSVCFGTGVILWLKAHAAYSVDERVSVHPRSVRRII